MDGPINRIAVYIFKIPFFSGIFIFDNTIAAQFNKLVFVAFVLNENGILPVILILKQEFYIIPPAPPFFEK